MVTWMSKAILFPYFWAEYSLSLPVDPVNWLNAATVFAGF